MSLPILKSFLSLCCRFARFHSQIKWECLSCLKSNQNIFLYSPKSQSHCLSGLYIFFSEGQPLSLDPRYKWGQTCQNLEKIQQLFLGDVFGEWMKRIKRVPRRTKTWCETSLLSPLSVACPLVTTEKSFCICAVSCHPENLPLFYSLMLAGMRFLIRWRAIKCSAF